MFVSFRKCSPPQKPDPISDRNCQNLYPISDQNGSKTIPFGTAHTYIPYIGEYPPPGLRGRQGVSVLTRFHALRLAILICFLLFLLHVDQVLLSVCAGLRQQKNTPKVCSRLFTAPLFFRGSTLRFKRARSGESV